MNAAVLSARDLAFFAIEREYTTIAATGQDPEWENDRRKLIALIAVYLREHLVDEISGRTALRFLDLLPVGRELPKLAPDGDGALTMLWEAQRVLLLSVDKRELLAITSPATPQAEHLPPAYIVGDAVSVRILLLIPHR